MQPSVNNYSIQVWDALFQYGACTSILLSATEFYYLLNSDVTHPFLMSHVH